MPMKNAPHPGEVVRTEVLQPLGLSLTKAAEIDVCRYRPDDRLTLGRRAPSYRHAIRDLLSRVMT